MARSAVDCLTRYVRLPAQGSTMKTMNLIFLFVILITVRSRAQNPDSLILPSPVVGWDSLSHLISYPELARRAGAQGGYFVRLQIDAMGNIRLINIFELSNYERQADTSLILSQSLYHVLDRTMWHPAMRDGEKVNCTITIPVIFTVKVKGQVDPIIKNILPATIHKDY